MNEAPPADVLFRDEVAKLLRCSPRSVAKLIPELLPRLDRHPRYSRAAVDAYMAGDGTEVRTGRNYFNRHKRAVPQLHVSQRRSARAAVQVNPCDQGALISGGVR